MSITITIDDTEVLNALKRLAQESGDMHKVFDSIGSALVTRVTDDFEAGRSPTGEAWEPLKRATQLGRLKRNKRNFRKKGALSNQGRRAASKGFQPLIDTGALMKGITHQADKTSVEVGSAEDYAALHQFGDSSRNLPARPFLPMAGLPDDWQADVLDEITTALEKAIHG